ncbi:acyltransferase [Hymenobacter sp. BT683]|uniref:Acyltransferase n=1 Tax=Hymenobacter jeongseonensis TaxID=2791027 RepID=A0ABS0IFK9_9BACT|nr:acyltransferase [Hymenobacter jeongseonensis]MBF9237141.1 acyltransferase [Hymenobacter jeongseonensis]
MPEATFYRRPSSPVYFPNLNGLRFVAALLVIINHIEQQRLFHGRPSLSYIPVVQRIGDEGVTLFFVLSGFLITYLLLLEQEQFGQIAVGQFYKRRALRIWPLYYAVVLLALLVLPNAALLRADGFSTDIAQLPQQALLHAVLLPNVALVLYGGIPFLSQAWSIGTEEQFYLVWPWVLRRAGAQVLPVVGGVFLLLLAAQRVIVVAFHAAQPEPGPVLAFAFNFLYFFRLDCLVVGAVPAILLFQRRTAVLRWLMAPAVQWLSLLAVLGLLAWGQRFPLHEQVYAGLFAVLILNLAAAKKPIITLEKGWLSYLGKLSYGLYMLHYLAVALVLQQWGPWLDTQIGWLRWLLTLLASLGLTVLLAMASYYGLERPFLQRKPRPQSATLQPVL